MNKKALFLILLGVLVLPSLASAQIIQNMVTAAVNTTWIIAVGVVVILWIVTGILFLTAQGDPSKLTLARKALLSSIVGTALAILAFSAQGLIGNSLGIV